MTNFLLVLILGVLFPPSLIVTIPLLLMNGMKNSVTKDIETLTGRD